jgi:hypothetical protein
VSSLDTTSCLSAKIGGGRVGLVTNLVTLGLGFEPMFSHGSSRTLYFAGFADLIFELFILACLMTRNMVFAILTYSDPFTYTNSQTSANNYSQSVNETATYAELLRIGNRAESYGRKQVLGDFCEMA